MRGERGNRDRGFRVSKMESWPKVACYRCDHHSLQFAQGTKEALEEHSERWSLLSLRMVAKRGGSGNPPGALLAALCTWAGQLARDGYADVMVLAILV
jgi:hypothetical protein